MRSMELEQYLGVRLGMMAGLAIAVTRFRLGSTSCW